jgi:hypothetical protein
LFSRTPPPKIMQNPLWQNEYKMNTKAALLLCTT